MSLTDRWQTPLRGERLSDLLLLCANYRNTDSSLPVSGRDSYLLKMARRSWMTSQLSPLLERDMLMFSVLTNYSGLILSLNVFFWGVRSSLMKSLTRLPVRHSPRPELRSQFKLNNFDTTAASQQSDSCSHSCCSGVVSGIHIKATQISSYSSSRKSEVKSWDGSDDMIKPWHWLISESYLLSANNQNKKPRTRHLQRIWSWRNMTPVPWHCYKKSRLLRFW